MTTVQQPALQKHRNCSIDPAQRRTLRHIQSDMLPLQARGKIAIAQKRQRAQSKLGASRLARGRPDGHDADADSPAALEAPSLTAVAAAPTSVRYVSWADTSIAPIEPAP